MDRLEAVAQEIEGRGGKALPVEMDVTSEDSVTGAFAEIADSLGRPCDVIVNNSGMSREGWFTKMSEDDWNAVMNTNLTGVWRVAKHGANAMTNAKVPGSIINIASITAFRTQYMSTAYCVSKAGVDHMTRQMALEMARSGVRVNAIAPGYFKTEINDDFLESEEGLKMIRRIGQRRIGEVSELSGALLLLASDAGSYMTGSTIVVDGGHTLSPL
ncbi:short chain dehydrogenase/reductase family oxidoreductase [Hyphomonas johnsonii MHS-2]|uniref:Short chain dehydrogenase/reductase family oxidoreductase n=2 Tax=Hyphomonas johnsonii TaxID=81031 RepID=A0A059FTE9_9PROT|nr:short chain dehydrogenase/reductase family oxidoreductase [Hyphomonas johnsonii MHS-2]